MTTLATDPAGAAAFIAEARDRATRAALATDRWPGTGLGLGAVRESAGDVPALADLATDGLLARNLVAAHAGWAERLDRVRQLHGPEDRGGGLLVCIECSRPFATALWPCTTMQVLDGMPEP